MQLSPIEIELLRNALSSICDEMYLALMKSAYSTNIKERKDHSAQTPLADRTAFVRGDSMTSESTVSPDMWDQSPNSPPFKSFNEKMAWARKLEQGITPLQADARNVEQSSTPLQASAEDLEQGITPLQTGATTSRDKKKPRPPLTSQSEMPLKKTRGRPSDIEEGMSRIHVLY